ncbi:DUF305 domain-containing protein [Plantactinospora sp. CA-290183]|uniref:DUF305 domain-containing protein n=1 Tax=Plantactinospora sp. CA-290183 TaxID=3240006 RepID=UPI003D8B115F
MRAGLAVRCGVLSVVVAVAGCAGGPPSDRPAPSPAATAAPSAASSGPPAAPGGTPAQPFNTTDVAWLQLAVAMGERVLPMLELVPARSTEPALRRLAVRLRDGHRAQLRTSRDLLARSGGPETNPHEGHDMPGMVTDAELRTLDGARGAAFHRLFLGHLRQHLEQSVRIARAEETAGADPRTKALAAEVVGSGSAALDALTQLDRRYN